VFGEGKKGMEEVAVRQEDSGVKAWVGPKGEDACDGGKSSSKDTVVACTDTVFDAYTVDKDQVGHNEVFGVGNQVDEHRGVVGQRVVGNL